MSGLRIGIDTLTVTAHPAGIGRTARGFLTGLAALPGDHSLVAVRAQGAALPAELARTEWIDAPVPIPDTPRALLWQHLRLPALMRAAGIDVYLGPAFVLPLRAPGVPEVVFVHDAAWRRFPETKTARFRRYMDLVVPRSMRRARTVVANSHFSVEECSELAPELPPERFHVVPCGLEIRETGETTAPPVPPPYLLTVSNFDPRKNLPRLVNAWRSCREGGLPHALVLVGNPERAQALREAMNIGDHEPVVTPGYVDDAELAALYAHADAVIVPSLYEGFGMPVVEALAAGVPVACANAGSLPEVAASDAELFDPRDEASIADALERIVREPPPAVARDRARRRARAMTWESSAAAMLEILEAAARPD